jgi:hypothetical protein
MPFLGQPAIEALCLIQSLRYLNDCGEHSTGVSPAFHWIGSDRRSILEEGAQPLFTTPSPIPLSYFYPLNEGRMDAGMVVVP